MTYDTQSKNAASDRSHPGDNPLVVKLAAAVENISTHMNELVRKPQSSPYITIPSNARMQGMGMIASGIVVLCVSAAVGIVSLGMAVVTLPLGIVGGLLTAGCITCGVTLISRGVGIRRLADRAKIWKEKLSLEEAVPLDGFASSLQIPIDALQKDINKAIKVGYIPQGRIDVTDGHTTLFLTDDAYEKQQEAYKAKQAYQERMQAVQDEINDLPDVARESIASCEACVKHMLDASGRITHPATRDRMASLAEKIGTVATYVRKHPEDVPHFRRYVNYYLPTITKLVDAYADLDAAHATGEIADSTRAEVDDMLELVSKATDTLLDDILLGQQMDIASDANTMRTMLTQDGLTD